MRLKKIVDLHLRHGYLAHFCLSANHYKNDLILVVYQRSYNG